MLTDVALKALKPREKIYKVADRDGMYVRVTPRGAISFLLDYRLNGRRETVHLGKYGHDGISLARAREKCLDARRAIREGRSPAIEKQRDKRRIKEAKSFGQFGEKWLTAAPMADSTRAMRRTIYERELLPVWRNRLLTEITPDDLRAHCGKIVDRSAPATAIHVRDIVKQIYGFAILHGEKVANPADEVGPASIATFVPRDRSLSPSEIRVMLKQLEHIATLPTIRLGMKLYLLTMVRKSELQDAVWDEVDFENSVWTIPKERMKRSKAHNVYLSRQTLDIMIALKTCAGNSRYLLPSRYDADAPMSRATFNRVTYAVVERAKAEGLPLDIRWELVKRLRRMETPVGPRNLDVSITVFCKFCRFFTGRNGCFAPERDAAASVRCCDQKWHGRRDRWSLTDRRLKPSRWKAGLEPIT
jgi:integrase